MNERNQARELDVPKELTMLRSLADEFCNTVLRLADRIEPLRRPSSPSVADETIPAVEVAPLANQIRDTRLILGESLNILLAIVDSLEI